MSESSVDVVIVPENRTPVQAGRRDWLALGVLALPTMVLSMDLTVLHLAAPSLSADLAPTGAQLLWILDVYGFTVAGFLLVMGGVGDRIGHRRLLLTGAAAFAVMSVVAAFAPTAEMLIAARALLGVAGATLMPATLALITRMFRTPAQRAFAIAAWMTAFTAGEAIGPLVGGLVLEFLWWGAVFLIGAPVMAVLLLVGRALLPESSARLPGRLDLLSAALLTAAALLLVYGVKTAAAGVDAGSLAWCAAGVVAGVAFARRQRGTADPLIDLRLFRLPAFSSALGVQLLAVAAMAGCQFLVIQHLQSVAGLTPLVAGLVTVPSVALGVAGTLLAPRLARRFGSARVIAGGLLLAVAGAVSLAVTAPGGPLTWTLASFTALYVGVTPTLALTTELIVSAAPPERAGSASSIAESGAEFGLAGGIAVIGTVAMATYRSRLEAGAPEGLHPGAFDAAAETVGGGVEVARDTPGETGTLLLDAVEHAFTSALQLAATVSAGLLLVAGTLAAVMLPTRRDAVRLTSRARRARRRVRRTCPSRGQ